MLRELTLRPAGFDREHVRPVLEAGVSPEAIEDAIHVSVVFNIMDRLADTLGFDRPEDGFRSASRLLFKRGYG